MATTQPSAAFLPAIDAERSGSAGGYSNGSGGPGGQVDVGGEARLLGSGSRPSLKQFPRRGARNDAHTQSAPAVGRQAGHDVGVTNAAPAAQRKSSRAKTPTPVDVEATKAVLVREALVRRLHLMVEKLVADSGGADAAERHNISEVLQRMLQLRTATVEAVEAVQSWGMRQKQRGYHAFMWNGIDYFIKMRHDIDFLADSPALVAALGVEADTLRHNPMMMPMNLTHRRLQLRKSGQLHVDGSWQAGSPPQKGLPEQERLNAAELLLVQHEAFEDAQQRPQTGGAIGKGNTVSERELRRRRPSGSHLTPLSYSQRVVPDAQQDTYDRSYDRNPRRRRRNDRALLPLSVDAAKSLYLPSRPPNALLNKREKERRRLARKSGRGGRAGRSRSPTAAWESPTRPTQQPAAVPQSAPAESNQAWATQQQPTTADSAGVGYGFEPDMPLDGDDEYFPDFGLSGGDVGASYAYVPGSSYTGPGSGVDPSSLPTIDAEKLAAAFRAHVPAPRRRARRSRTRGSASGPVGGTRRRRGGGGRSSSIGSQRERQPRQASPDGLPRWDAPGGGGASNAGLNDPYGDNAGDGPVPTQVSQAHIRNRKANAVHARRGRGMVAPVYRSELGALEDEQAREKSTRNMMNRRRAPGIQVRHTSSANSPTSPAGGVYGHLDTGDVAMWDGPRPGGVMDDNDAPLTEEDRHFIDVLGLRASEVVALGHADSCPPELVLTATTTLILLQQGSRVPPNLTWPALRQELRDVPAMSQKLAEFNAGAVAPFKLRALKPFLAAAKLVPGRAPVLPRVAHSLTRFILGVLSAKQDSLDMAGPEVVDKLRKYVNAFPSHARAYPVRGAPAPPTAAASSGSPPNGAAPPPPTNLPAPAHDDSALVDAAAAQVDVGEPGSPTAGGSGAPAAPGPPPRPASKSRKKRGKKRSGRRRTKSPRPRSRSRSRSRGRPRATSPTALAQRPPGGAKPRRSKRNRGGAAPGPPSVPPAPPPMAPPSDDEDEEDEEVEVVRDGMSPTSTSPQAKQAKAKAEQQVRFADTVVTNTGAAAPLAGTIMEAENEEDEGDDGHYPASPDHASLPPPPPPPMPPSQEELEADAAEAEAAAAEREAQELVEQAARMEALAAEAEQAAEDQQRQYMEHQPVISHRSVRLTNAEYLVVSASARPSHDVISVRTYDPRTCEHMCGAITEAELGKALGIPAATFRGDRAVRAKMCEAVTTHVEKLAINYSPDPMFAGQEAPVDAMSDRPAVMHGAIVVEDNVAFVHTYELDANHEYSYRKGLLVKLYMPDAAVEYHTELAVPQLMAFGKAVKLRYSTYDKRFHKQILSHLQLTSNHHGAGPRHVLVLINAAVRRRSLVLASHVEAAAGYEIEDSQKQRAALTIQGSFRCKLARQEVAAKRREQRRTEGMAEHLATIDESEREDAALAVQCAMRQRAARRRVAQQRRDRALLAEREADLAAAAADEEAHKAALAIQCRQRQRKAKQAVAERRTRKRLAQRKVAATRIQAIKRGKSARLELERRRALANTAIGKATVEARPLVRAAKVLGGRGYVVSVTRRPRVANGRRGHTGGYLFRAEPLSMDASAVKQLVVPAFAVIPSAQIAQVVGLREAKSFQELEDLKQRVAQLTLLRGRLVVGSKAHDDHCVALRLPVVFSTTIPTSAQVSAALDAAADAEEGGEPPAERTAIVSCYVEHADVGTRVTEEHLAADREADDAVHIDVHDMDSVTDSHLELTGSDAPQLVHARHPERVQQALTDVANDIVLWVQAESEEAAQKQQDAGDVPKVRAVYVPNAVLDPVVATEVDLDAAAADPEHPYDVQHRVVLKAGFRVSGRSLLVNVQRTPSGSFGIAATDTATGQSLCLSVLELEAQLAADDPEGFLQGDFEAVKAAVTKIVDVLMELVTDADGVTELRVLPTLPQPFRCSRNIDGVYYVINVGAGGGGVYLVDVVDPRSGWTASLPVSSLDAGLTPHGKYEEEVRKLCTTRLRVEGEGEERELVLA